MFAEKGTWPMAGGVLDQSWAFVDAVEATWADRERFKALSYGRS
jgi:hypothetical protein